MVQVTSVFMSVALLVAPAFAAVTPNDSNAPTANNAGGNEPIDGIRCDLASFACKQLPLGNEFCCEQAGGSSCHWNAAKKDCESS